jgi:fumarylacetoacetase
MPNWLHIPVAYHGRASSVILSGHNIPRPKGQTNNAMTEPIFEPSGRVDIELEMGFFYGGKSNKLGETVSIDNAHKHIFGMVLVNDWSARDIQKWEYQPLGPFLSKNFATSISPWVVPMEALESFKVDSPKKEKDILPYLQESGKNSYDIDLEVYLQTPTLDEPFLLSKSNHKYLYWSLTQHVAHHTITGCVMNAGDLIASGTISGPTEDSYGSMMELAWKGEKPIELPNGEKRVFLKDGDTITIKGFCGTGQHRIGFGEVKTTILPTL